MENRIKELREQKKISQVCLATYVGCSQNMISKIELGISELKQDCYWNCQSILMFLLIIC